MHHEAYEYTRLALARIGGATDKHILEIGSLNINGGARELCWTAASYTGLDKVQGPGVDMVADIKICSLPRRYALIICNEVLEHDPDPEKIIAACAAGLDVGGHLILTCASDDRKPHNAYGAEHPEPGEYYGNVSPGALYSFLPLSEWKIIDLSYLYPPGDARLIAQRIAVKES